MVCTCLALNGSGLLAAPPSTVTAKSDEKIFEPYESKRGPWGILECYDFYLEAPENLTSQFRLPSSVTRWSFPRQQLSSLPELLAQAGLDEAFIKQLVEPARIVTQGETIHLFPAPDRLEAMSPETRTTVYALLAGHPANEYHQYPVYFLTDSVDAWAEDSGLPMHIVDTLSAYSYYRGGTLAFSDAPALMRACTSDAEARLVARKLTRIRTVFARIRLEATTEIPGILNYWTTGLGLRRKELEPLLMAATRTRGVGEMDIVHLLPPLARKLHYTYPGSDLMAQGQLPDCHWSTLNFFNSTPENHFLDQRLATTAILENFDRVEPPYRFGDVLMFVAEGEIARHSCNYVADDLVYTKNGSSLMQPFMLMHLGDLEKLYDVDSGKTRVVAFRHKGGGTDTGSRRP